MAGSRGSSSIEQRRDSVVLCNCDNPTKISRAWTVKNPGQRFYSCRGRKSGNGYENCNFFEWFDIEKPQGWQHEALLEAREVMNRQRKEIKSLRDTIDSLGAEGGRVTITQTRDLVEETKQICEVCEKMKNEVLILNERSKVYRNVLISSSVGFTIAIGVILVLWKH